VTGEVVKSGGRSALRCQTYQPIPAAASSPTRKNHFPMDEDFAMIAGY